MNHPLPNIENQDTLLAEAAAWRVRLTEAGVASTPEFDAWLQQPEHAAAWHCVAAPWDLLGAAAHTPDLGVELQKAKAHAWRARAQRQHSMWSRIAVAASIGMLIAITGWSAAWWLDRPDTYRAGIGERRVITLVDGSHLSLDSNSEVTVKYTKSARELHLKRGQALFDVAHDVRRPFSVVAGDRKVIATGTAFNIEVDGPTVLVTLIEGRVTIVDDRPLDPLDNSPRNAHVTAQQLAARRSEIELHAGQQLTATPQQPAEVITANIQGVTAWMNGQIMVDNELLSAVVERVNHYTTIPIVVSDAQVANLRISGVFKTGDVSGFIDTVTQYLPLHAVPSTTTIELRSGK